MSHMSNHLKNAIWIHEAAPGNVYFCESIFYSLHYKTIFMQDKICIKPLLDSFHTHTPIILKERIPHISYTPTPIWETHTFFMPAKHVDLKVRWNMFPPCLFLHTCNKELMLLSVQHIVVSFTYKPSKTFPLLASFPLMYSVGAATLPTVTSSFRPWHAPWISSEGDCLPLSHNLYCLL